MFEVIDGCNPDGTVIGREKAGFITYQGFRNWMLNAAVVGGNRRTLRSGSMFEEAAVQLESMRYGVTTLCGVIAVMVRGCLCIGLRMGLTF